MMAYNICVSIREAPFGNEHLLPRGTLREPPEHLRRATHILITKCDGSDTSDLRARIRKYNRTAPILECRHRPVELQDVTTGQILPLEKLKGLRAGALSAIASPESFEQGLRRLGAQLELMQSFADHHRYSKREMERFLSRCERRGVSCILTTEKDAVRMPHLIHYPVPIYYLRIEIEILNGQELWTQLVDQLVHHPKPLVDDSETRTEEENVKALGKRMEELKSSS
jgi:tetraacyldisaccharide 4'-kinase